MTPGTLILACNSLSYGAVVGRSMSSRSHREKSTLGCLATRFRCPDPGLSTRGNGDTRRDRFASSLFPGPDGHGNDQVRQEGFAKVPHCHAKRRAGTKSDPLEEIRPSKCVMPPTARYRHAYEGTTESSKVPAHVDDGRYAFFTPDEDDESTMCCQATLRHPGDHRRP